MLNKQFVANGWNRKPTGRILLELGINLTLSLGGIAILIVSDSWLMKAVGMLISTTGSLGISTNTHTSSHYATCDKRWKNRALTYFGYTFYFGASASYWWNKHVAVHHPTPNVMGFDDDADLMPFFAINQKDFDNARGLLRLWFKVQWIFIPVAIFFNCFNLQNTSWRYLARQLRNPATRTAAHWVDLGVLVLHLLAWLVIPAFIFGWWNAFLFYVVRIGLMGYALFIAFAPAHFPAEAVFLDKEIENKAEYFRKADFILLQTATTVNFRTGPLGRLLCAGVEYQIEHHLFPGISHVYYPQVSVILKKFCEENGYPYRTLGWWEAIVKSLAVFYKPKPVVPRLQELSREVQTSSSSDLDLPAAHLVT
jgi:fatty acid desaturase